MKCNLSLNRRMTKKQKDELQKYIEDEAHKYIIKENHDCVRRLYKLIAINLNKKYGFGKKRLIDLFNDCGEKALNEQNQDEVFWRHADDRVINQLGLTFERENYDVMDR